MKDSGKTIKYQKESKKIKLAFIKALLSIEKGLEEANIIGEMVSIIMGNGKMGKKMEVDTGNLINKILIWVNGKMDKLQVMGCIQLILVKDMKVNL